ncbi:MAG: Fic family protein [Candidatus Nanohaloarchaeota archaeon QJJ-9]|nr:Fic family protein [Candidatus Nanohaloarchaeota archaeon QJJ-9]
MDLDEFTNERAGCLKEVSKDGENFHTFEPHSLPPEEIQYSQRMVRLIEDAASNLNDLSGTGRNLPNPNIFIRPYIVKEAVLSSQIEGTQTTFEEAIVAEGEDIESRERQFDMEEVYNYVDALKFGIKQLEFKELSLELIKNIHRRLMSGVRGKDSSPGEFRDTFVHIGDLGVSREDADFIPMSPSKIEPAMEELVTFMKKETDMPYLVKSALTHYQFEAIHPFKDGNGRLGRLLIVLDMIRNDKLSQPLLYLSEYFNKNKTQYYDRLLNVSKRGEYEEWIKFFLRAVKNQSQKSSEKAASIIEKQKEYRKQLREANVPDKCIHLMEKFFDLQPRTIQEVEIDEELDVSYQTARNYLKTLEEEGLVVSRQKGREKVFVPQELIQIMQDDTEHIKISPPPK